MYLEGNMLVLSEESVKEFIQNDKVLVKVWAQNCPYCTKLDDHLARVDLSGFSCGMLEVSHPMDKSPRPSEFKRTWMRVEKSDVVKDSVPALFVFEKGELKYRNFGMLYADSLQHWLQTGEVVPSKMQQEERAAQERQKRLYELFAQKGELTHNIEAISSQLNKINAQIGELLK